MEGRKKSCGRKIWWWSVASILLLWLVFCPSFIGRCIVEKIALSRLNDPGLGLSCESVDVKFGYFQILKERRVSRLEIRGLRMDASKYLTGAATNLVEDRTIVLDKVFLDGDARSGRSGMDAGFSGRILDWPAFADGVVDVKKLLSPAATGDFTISLMERAAGTVRPDYVFRADFGTEGGEWSARLGMDEAAFDETDPVLGAVVSRLVGGTVSNLVFGGSVALDAAVRKTEKVPVPVWNVTVPVRSVSLGGELGGRPLALDGLKLDLAASGIADHFDVAPLNVRARSLEFYIFAASNLYAQVRKDPTGFLVTEAGARLCGGSARVYSLALDPETLDTGLTLIVDDLDAGQVLSMVPGFRGTATGRVHGKLPFSIRDGGTSIRLRDTFLYSTPGETGRLQLDDPAVIVDNLRAAGVTEAECRNLSKALKALDYSALKLRLIREDRHNLALNVKIEGSATSGKTTVPVSFEVTFHGAIEQLFNFGLRTANLRSRKQ
ncbi:MAG: YdbH domain-containing protein [Kiritimatiellae bacterium]|nr:YdbH domain-containing protein [Kiritimatiellia bacterium]